VKTATTGETRTWVLEPVGDRGERALVGGLLVLVWGPVELVLARAADVPDAWTDLPLLSLLGALLAGWSYVGFLGLRTVVTRDRGRVVTADQHGIRSERVTRRGRRRTAEVSWDDIRDVEVRPVHLSVDGGRGPITLSLGSHEPGYREIADHIEERITPPEGQRRLPIIDGWTAWLDDNGPTLSTRRDSRRKVARWTGVLAGVLWVDTAAAATDLGGLWGLTAVLGAAAAGLTALAVRYARTTPRWTAVPGSVVRLDKPGGKVTFRASALELVAVDNGGGIGIGLIAVDGTKRVNLVYAAVERLVEVGRWLADAAEIPFRDLRPEQAGSGRG
jgi:hypothetical protein